MPHFARWTLLGEIGGQGEPTFVQLPPPVPCGALTIIGVSTLPQSNRGSGECQRDTGLYDRKR